MADPSQPQLLWAWGSFEVEVPEEIASRRVTELQGGAPVLAAGRLSERWVIENGRSCKRSVIVAALIHSGPPPEPLDELLLPGGRP